MKHIKRKKRCPCPCKTIDFEKSTKKDQPCPSVSVWINKLFAGSKPFQTELSIVLSEMSNLVKSTDRPIGINILNRWVPRFFGKTKSGANETKRKQNSSNSQMQKIMKTNEKKERKTEIESKREIENQNEKREK